MRGSRNGTDGRDDARAAAARSAARAPRSPLPPPPRMRRHSLARARNDLLAKGGEHHVLAGPPVQDRRVELTLQSQQPRRQRGLRHRARLRRPAEVLKFGQRQQDTGVAADWAGSSSIASINPFKFIHWTTSWPTVHAPFVTDIPGRRISMPMDTNVTAEAKCPVVGHTTRLARMNRDWWPNQLNLQRPLPEPAGGEPARQDVQLRRRVQDARPRRGGRQTSPR